MNIVPITKLGKWSIGLIVTMPMLFVIGSLLVNVYEGVSSGETILKDIVARPGVALPMLAGFGSGIAAFVTGLVALTKGKERAVLVFLSTIVGALLILFLVAEITSPH
ncbi:MAG: hypothetical protein ABIG66_05120 [Candidatus Kerfeldbacteria bacterium]